MSTPTIIAVTVDVTREHLAAGRPGNCCRCALALAAIDARRPVAPFSFTAEALNEEAAR